MAVPGFFVPTPRLTVFAGKHIEALAETRHLFLKHSNARFEV